MPIEMPKGLPFSVDTWSPCSKKKRHHFLTHAHKDHSTGISAHFSYPIYSTHLTKSLLLQHYPQVSLNLPCFERHPFYLFFSSVTLILVGFCSLTNHCLWVSRWDNRWLSMTRMAISVLRPSMQITALVYDSLLIYFDRFCLICLYCYV